MGAAVSAYRRPSLTEDLAFHRARGVAPGEAALWPWRSHPSMAEILAREEADRLLIADAIDRRRAKMERCDD